MKIVLASASPRRKELLKEICSEFEVCPTAADENFIGASPAHTVKEIALRKVAGVSGDLVIGCDTVVFMDGKYYNKPSGRTEAIAMITTLVGKTHEVYSGLAIAYNNKIYQDCEKSEVVFKNLSESDIAKYVDTFAPYDKAGGYGIQDSFLVDSYRGSYSNIMGLPLEKLSKLLIRLGVSNG